MITLPRSTELSPARDAIAARLEQEYETHTEFLATLTAPRAKNHHRANPTRAAAHADAVSASRRALSDVAQALRRLAEGTYGACEYCCEDIPLDDLERTPAARCCHGCGVGAAY